MKATPHALPALPISLAMRLHLVTISFLLLLTGCTQTNPLLDWDPQSENLAGLRILVEAEGPDFDAHPFSSNEILFTSARAGNLDVYLANLDGSFGVMQMTSGGGFDGLSSTHPNGQSFVFLSDRSGESNPDYYMGERGNPVAKRLVSVAEPVVGSWKAAQISPDGTTLLYTSSSSIWTYGLETGNKVQWVEGYDPAWHPDGQRIVFTRVARNSGGITTTSIWLMNADGTNVTEIIPGGEEVSVSHPRISPDGQRICYERATVQRGYNFVRSQGPLGELRKLSGSDIWVTNIDGTNSTQLTTHPIVDPKVKTIFRQK